MGRRLSSEGWNGERGDGNKYWMEGGVDFSVKEDVKTVGGKRELEMMGMTEEGDRRGTKDDYEMKSWRLVGVWNV